MGWKSEVHSKCPQLISICEILHRPICELPKTLTSGIEKL
jgi:hypothetical protein